MNPNTNLNIQWDLLQYKVFPCAKEKCNKKFECVFYHNKSERRRKHYHKYEPKTCIQNINSFCIKKDNCKYSHNNNEILYHPKKYKNQFCAKSLKDCKYGIYCCNAHSEYDIRIEWIHKLPFDYNFFLYKFKTIFCPIFVKHKKDTCVYAHNYQDYRRKPKNNINNVNCKNWNKDEIISFYSKDCNYHCNFCHGWKEFNYHAKNYKIIVCDQSYNLCKYKLHCPKNHGLEFEKSFLDFKDNKFFIYACRN